MKIAVDAMGGDKAPFEIVKGAVEARTIAGLEILLVGQEIPLWEELKRYASEDRRHIKAVYATEVVGMGEHCANAIRSKPDSSVVVCANLVKSGEAEGMFTAGNTGAAMSVATLRFGRIEEVDRPAIATVLPTTNGGQAIMLDAGANVDCSVDNLVQFALMGEAYAWSVLGIKNPRVFTLNIGEEYSKGNALTKAVNGRLSEQKGLNFKGNLDAKHIFDGEADVIVCDGFSGNLALKIAEATAEVMGNTLKQEIAKSFIYKLGGALIRPAARRARAKLDYSEYGGAPLLGINGICIIGHGRSDAKAVANGIGVTADAVKAGIVWKITQNLAA